MGHTEELEKNVRAPDLKNQDRPETSIPVARKKEDLPSYFEQIKPKTSGLIVRIGKGEIITKPLIIISLSNEGKGSLVSFEGSWPAYPISPIRR
jgi:hypothetical protein